MSPSPRSIQCSPSKDENDSDKKGDCKDHFCLLFFQPPCLHLIPNLHLILRNLKKLGALPFFLGG